MKNDCPLRPMAADFVNGELSADAASDFTRHLAGCASCRAEVESTRHLIRTLRAIPEAEPSPDLTESILARVRSEQSAKAGLRWLRPAAAAAAVALISFVFWKQMQHPAAPHVAEAGVSSSDPASASLRMAVDWLRANQEPDGSWDGKKWGGRSEFQVALTALPALAMITSGSGGDPAVMKAVDWLKARQSANGVFGEPGIGLPYNHCLATLTLLHVSEKEVSQSLRTTIGPAITAMLRSQTRDGGWGHYRSPYAENAITAWHVQTLELASSLGWENAKPALERGKSWLRANGRSAGLTPDALPDRTSPSPLLDLCGTYFLASQLSREDAPGARVKLAAIRGELLGQQIAAGEDAGSWPPDGLRGNVGGRLYSTALASMALNDP